MSFDHVIHVQAFITLCIAVPVTTIGGYLLAVRG